MLRKTKKSASGRDRRPIARNSRPSRLWVEALERRSLLTLIGASGEIQLPYIAYSNTSNSSTAAAIRYDANTDVLAMDATPSQFLVVAPRGSAISGGTTNGNTAGDPLNWTAASRDFLVRVRVDGSGNLVGGVSGDDLIVTGVVSHGGTTYTGTPGNPLLTGEVTGFGFLDGTSNNVNPTQLETDFFDFRFTATGGQLASFYAGKDLGVTATAESSNFETFAGNFTASAKGNLGSIPKPASIGDRVWHDLDADGLQDAGEPGIVGATVRLLTGAGAVVGTTTTGADGIYGFANLAPGSYKVEFATPAGFALASPANAGADAADSDAVGGTTGLYTLASGETNLTVDAGFYNPAALGDRVWKDLNINGLQDAGEPGVAGFPVALLDGGGNVVATTTTDGGGLYLFDNLVPGAYKVTFGPLPPQYIGFTIQNAGSNDAVDSDADPANGLTQAVTLVSGGLNLTLDAGLVAAAAGVDIVKLTNGTDNNSPTGPVVPVGSTVTFTYIVTNTGNVPLAGVTVTDDQGVAVTFVGGDADNDGRLDTSETWTYTGTTVATAGQYVNTGTVTGNPVTEGGVDIPGLPDPTDSDVDHHFAAAAGIDIVKLTNGTDNNSPTGPVVPVGSTVTFTYIVTNTGNVPLAGVTVTDDQGVAVTFVGGDADNDGRLDTSETWTYTGTTVATAGQYVNTGTVTGNPVTEGGVDIPGLPDPTDSDVDHHFAAAAGIDIVKEVSVDGGSTFFDANLAPFPKVKSGNAFVFRYRVRNTGNVQIANLSLVDDNATPGNPNDNFNPTPVLSGGFNVGDADKDGRLDTTETWEYRVTRTAQFLNSTSRFPVATSEIDKYLLIGTTSNDTAKAVNVQNGDLGADVIMLSNEINDNVDFQNRDVFQGGPSSGAPNNWTNVDDAPTYNAGPGGSDYLQATSQLGTTVRAARVFEGISWSGDVALTSPNAKFDMSNVEVYADLGVVAASSNPVSSVSNTKYFDKGVLPDNGPNPTNGQPLPPNGLTASATTQMTALRGQLDAMEAYIRDLLPEVTLNPSTPGINDFGNGNLNNQKLWVINVDQFDANNDGIAVIDLSFSGDINLTNTNLVIQTDPAKKTFAIFRILGGSNFLVNQSTIVLGDGYTGGSANNDPLMNLGAVFVKATGYKNGSGGRNAGEGNTGDTVFSFNDTVLNGVGFWDLIIFGNNGNNNPNGSAIGNANFDNGTTELKINNGQGCSQFISPKINFNDVRFDHCNLPSIGEESQTNTVVVNGTAVDSGGVAISGVAVAPDSDTATYWVSATTTSSPPSGGSSGSSSVASAVAAPLPSISGAVYLDGDDDGIRDAGEAGIGGVTIKLTGVDDQGQAVLRIRTTSTTGDVGSYRFDDLRPGTYRVEAVQLDAYLDGKDTAGDLGGNAAVDDAISAIVLENGSTAEGYNFGELLPSSLSGFVFVDPDGDGRIDLGEMAVAGATVTLSGTDDRGMPVSRTAVTDTNGVYSFLGLRPGNYAITEAQPSDLLDGGETIGTLGGSSPANDTFAVTIGSFGQHGYNYNFGERPIPGDPLPAGRTATIGFWSSDSGGQALIRSLNGGPESTNLSTWLAASFPRLYGAQAWSLDLSGKTNAEVAEMLKGLYSVEGLETEAQVLATALAAYVTDPTLAGDVATAYGFQVYTPGAGGDAFNVGDAGEALGVAGDSILSIFEILRLADEQALYGYLHYFNFDVRKRTLVTDLFDKINGTGGIGL